MLAVNIDGSYLRDLAPDTTSRGGESLAILAPAWESKSKLPPPVVVPLRQRTWPDSNQVKEFF